MKVKAGSKQHMSEWEHRIIAYNQRLEEFFDLLPTAMQTLIEDVPTKDADVLRYLTQDGVSFGLTLRVASYLSFTLHYTLAGVPEFVRVCWWPRFSKTQIKWLHDELDQQMDGLFVHTILLSDGMVLKVPFRNFKIKRLDYDAELPNKTGIPTSCV